MSIQVYAKYFDNRWEKSDLIYERIESLNYAKII